MNGEPLKKQKISKWIKIPLFIVGSLIMLIYGFYQLMLPSWHNTYGVSSELTVLNAVTGAYPSEFEWEGRLKFDDKLLKTECTEYIRTKDYITTSTYAQCIDPSPWGGGPGCAWWRFEGCSAFSVDDFILTQPKVLGHLLHAFKAPCDYLPTLDEIQKARTQTPGVGSNLKDTNEYLRCETDRRTFSDKIVLSVIDDTGNVVAQYIQHPQKNAVETIDLLEFILKKL